MTTDIITTGPELQDLAGAINREHAAATAAAKTAVAHALNAGRLLLQAKAQMAHGEFLPWLRSHCAVKQRQARQYTRLAKGWATIEAKTAPGADLTIKGALRLLDERPSETPTPQAGDAQVRINAAFGLPDELQPDETLTAAITDGGMMAEIIPCEQPGYVYLAVYFDLDTDNGQVEYTRRGIAGYAVGIVLQRCFGITPGALPSGWKRDAFEGGLPWYIKANATSIPGRCRHHAYHGRDAQR